MVALGGNQKVVGLNLEVVYDVALFRNKWTQWVQLHIFPFTNDDRKVLWEYCNKMMGQVFTVIDVSSVDFII